MSVKIMGKAWELDLETSELLILLAMADHADHEGNNVRPSTRLIAWKTGFSERHVRRVIDKLVSEKILMVTNAPKGKTITYRIVTENGKQKEPLGTDKVSPLTSKTHTPDTVSSPPLTSETLTPDIAMSPESSVEPYTKPLKEPINAVAALGDTPDNSPENNSIKEDKKARKERLDQLFEIIALGSFGKPYAALNGQRGRAGEIRKLLLEENPDITPEYLKAGYARYFEANPTIKYDPSKRMKKASVIIDWCEQAADCVTPVLLEPDKDCPKCRGLGYWIDKSNPNNHQSIDCECRSKQRVKS